MSDRDAIEKYVRELEVSLRRAGRPTEPLVDEARAHLYEDAARIAERERCGDSEATRLALARFGAVAELVRAARKEGGVAVAGVARVASIVLLAGLAWQTMLDVVDAHLFRWLHPSELYASLLFSALLAGTTVALWRALARGAVELLLIVLIVQAAAGLWALGRQTTPVAFFQHSA